LAVDSPCQHAAYGRRRRVAKPAKLVGYLIRGVCGDIRWPNVVVLYDCLVSVGTRTIASGLGRDPVELRTPRGEYHVAGRFTLTPVRFRDGL